MAYLDGRIRKNVKISDMRVIKDILTLSDNATVELKLTFEQTEKLRRAGIWVDDAIKISDPFEPTRY